MHLFFWLLSHIYFPCLSILFCFYYFFFVRFFFPLILGQPAKFVWLVIALSDFTDYI